MSTPDQKRRDDGSGTSSAVPAAKGGGPAAGDSDLALGETMAGLPGRAVSASETPASKPEALTLPEEKTRTLAPLRKRLPDPLEKDRDKDKSAREKVIENELPRGASLGRYIVLSCLGAGGMGVVYAAYDPELDRKVAIKLLRTDVGGAGGTDANQARLRLLREAQAMARLQHPQVIAIYDVGTIKEQVFIAMELIDGTTLTQWLKDQPRTKSQILDVFTLAGRGLAAAHAVGLVHRDFKPDNVLVGKDGQVRVTDFGLARSVDQSDEYAKIVPDMAEPTQSQPLSVQLTRTGALMGTPRYMAPEQYSGAKTDPRTDQFSFCVALYEAVYGVPPFAGDNIATLGYNVSHGRVLSAPPEARVPTWMRQVLLRGLSVSPDDRYKNMDALLASLNRERSGSSWLWYLSIGFVALVLIGNLAYHLRKEDRESPCRGSEKRLAGIWDPARKQEIKTKLLATGKSYAEDSWQRIEQTLDAYTQGWAKMRTAACMATVRGEQSPAIFDLRRRCLDINLQELVALTSVLSNAEEGVIEHASTAVHDLPSLSLCADVEALRAPPPLPENPKERAQVEKLNQQLAEARSEQRFGRYGVVIERAREIAQRAYALKYLPVQAEALYLLGQVEERGGMARQAEKTFVKAAAAAMESHNQRLVAQTWIRLTSLTGWALREPEKAESWEMLADAALDSLSLSDSQPLLAQLQLSRCRVQTARRAYDRAVEYCQQALTLRSKLNGSMSPEVAEVLHTLGSIYRRQNDFEQAMRFFQQALEIEQKQLGGLHPDIASELRGIGLLLREQRRYRDALDYLLRSLNIVQKSLGPNHIRTSDFHLLVGTDLMYQNRVVEAQRHFQRCFEIREAAGDGEYERRAEARYFLGQALARLGRYNEALSLNQVGLELAERDLNRKETRVALNLHAIGVILLALGRNSEAIPYLERALSIRQNQRDEERRSSLNRLAETQFALAQALWSLGRTQPRKRAIVLARAAQTNYTDWGNKPENELAAVTAWLAAGPVKPSQLAALGFGSGRAPESSPGAPANAVPAVPPPALLSAPPAAASQAPDPPLPPSEMPGN